MGTLCDGCNDANRDVVDFASQDHEAVSDIGTPAIFLIDLSLVLEFSNFLLPKVLLQAKNEHEENQ